MKLITKQEAFYLREEGYEEFVKHTHTKYKKYYVVEEKDDVYKYNKKKRERELVRLSALNMLKKYRRSRGQTD